MAAVGIAMMSICPKRPSATPSSRIDHSGRLEQLFGNLPSGKTRLNTDPQEGHNGLGQPSDEP
jgi:hypothetical protein